MGTFEFVSDFKFRISDFKYANGAIFDELLKNQARCS